MKKLTLLPLCLALLLALTACGGEDKRPDSTPGGSGGPAEPGVTAPAPKHRGPSQAEKDWEDTVRRAEDEMDDMVKNGTVTDTDGDLTDGE